MEFVEIFKAIILGIVQGITEWLPISSTGHMILADEFIQLEVSQAFREMFFVVIQFGSILAVVFLAGAFLTEAFLPPPSCLFTVAHAIRSADSVERPWAFSLSSM